MGIIPDKFNNEALGGHWLVNESKESFFELLNHLTFTTNNLQHFLNALSNPKIQTKPKDIIVADIGAGVGWTSAIIALDPRVKKVYVIEPSQNRLDIAPFVAKHFGAKLDKLVYMNGTFINLKLPEKVDLVILSGALHHCKDKEIPVLFKNIRDNLNPTSNYYYKDYKQKDKVINCKSKILISGEHYLNPIMIFWRIIRYITKLDWLKQNNEVFFRPFHWNDSHEWSGEHNRLKSTLDNIFEKEKFKTHYSFYKGDLIDPNLNYKSKLIKFLYKFHFQILYYYYAILEFKE
tara:strand:- start:660 stop:1532 length:873 start_codon:yes stop_codon:yes gene_type:complete